jgi:hypothetical protein
MVLSTLLFRLGHFTAVSNCCSDANVFWGNCRPGGCLTCQLSITFKSPGKHVLLLMGWLPLLSGRSFTFHLKKNTHKPFFCLSLNLKIFLHRQSFFP